MAAPTSRTSKKFPEAITLGFPEAILGRGLTWISRKPRARERHPFPPSSPESRDKRRLGRDFPRSGVEENQLFGRDRTGTGRRRTAFTIVNMVTVASIPRRARRRRSRRAPGSSGPAAARDASPEQMESSTAFSFERIRPGDGQIIELAVHASPIGASVKRRAREDRF